MKAKMDNRKFLFMFMSVVSYLLFWRNIFPEISVESEHSGRCYFNIAIRYYRDLSRKVCSFLRPLGYLFSFFFCVFYFLYKLIIRIDLLLIFTFNVCHYIYLVVKYVFLKIGYCVSLVILCTGLMPIISFLMDFLSPVFFFLKIYIGAILYVLSKFNYNNFNYYCNIAKYSVVCVKFYLNNFSFFFYGILILAYRKLLSKIIYLWIKLCLKVKIISLKTLKLFYSLVKLYIKFYFYYFLITCVIIPLFVLYLAVIYLVWRPINFFVIKVWRILLKLMYVAFTLKIWWATVKHWTNFLYENRFFYREIDFYSPVTVFINDLCLKLFVLTTNVGLKLKNSIRFLRNMDAYDVYILSRKLGRGIAFFFDVIVYVIYIICKIVYKVVVILLSPAFWVVRPIWNYIDDLTWPLQRIVLYKIKFPRRSPFKELNEELPTNISENAREFNRNTNKSYVTIIQEVLGHNVGEYMFDSIDENQLFRTDYDYLDTEQFTFSYVLSNTDCTAEEHAEFHAYFGLNTMEEITGDPYSKEYHPMRGPAYSRETFNIPDFLSDFVKAHTLGNREVTKSHFSPDASFIHGQDEDEFPAGNALKKRIAWFLKYYEYISKRFSLFMNGHLPEMDFDSLREEAKREKIFSKKYKRRHTFRNKLIYDIERPGFLYLSPTFLAKVESLLKKDLSEFFFVYGDPQFKLEDRFSPRMLFHGVLNLVVLFFILAYIIVPKSEMMLFYQCFFLTIIFVTCGLLIYIYLVIFKRRTGLISRKGLLFDGYAQAIPELLGVWCYIMFIILSIYFSKVVVINSWLCGDVVFLQDALYNDMFFLDWLIGVHTNHRELVLKHYYYPIFSAVEGARLLNDGVWNGQIYKPTYLVYATDLGYTRENFIHFVFSHYKFLWENVPSPVIAIIGDTCMFIKERYKIDNLPSSFSIQNYLLDLKYKVFYAKLLEYDERVFAFLKKNLSTVLFDKICGAFGWFADCVAFMKYSILILFGLDKASSTIPLVKTSQIKVAQFYPQVNKLEEDLSTKRFESVSTGTFFQDLWSCVLGDMPLKIRELPVEWYRIYEFPLSTVLLSVFSYIFKFFFFDIYVFLGFPFYKYSDKVSIGIELYNKWPVGITSEFSFPASQMKRWSSRFFESGRIRKMNYDSLISPHDLLDDYSSRFSYSSDLALGQDFLNKARFALSPVLKNNYTAYNSGNGGLRHLFSNLAYMNIFRVANKLQEVSMASLFATPWEVIMHSATSVYTRALQHFFDKQFNGIDVAWKWCDNPEMEEKSMEYLNNLIWSKITGTPKNSFSLLSTVDANHAVFAFTDVSNKDFYLNVFHYHHHQDEFGGVEFDIMIPSYSWYDYIRDKNIILIGNLFDENFFKYGATIDQLYKYWQIQQIEMSIKDIIKNPGGRMSNVLYFYYSSVAKCLYNERFFSDHYNYPLFYVVDDSFKGKCIAENIKTNLLLNSDYIVDYKALQDYIRDFDNSYTHLALGIFEEPFEKKIGEMYLQDNVREIRVPQIKIGDLGVINKSNNLFEYYFNSLLNNSNKTSPNNVYLHLFLGDEYTSTHLTSKFYDGFFYYLIERDGKSFVVPLDIWLRDSTFFQEKFISHYDRNKTDYTAMSLSEIYFRCLDDPIFFKDIMEYYTAGVGNGKDKYLPALRTIEHTLLLNFIGADINNIKGTGIDTDTDTDTDTGTDTDIDTDAGTDNNNTYSVSLSMQGHLSVLPLLRAIDPIENIARGLPVWATEYNSLFIIWEKAHEYFNSVVEDIKTDGQDSFVLDLKMKNRYREILLDCCWYMWHLVQLTEPSVERQGGHADVDVFNYFNNLVKNINFAVTSPYLLECKQELFEILKSEILAGSLSKTLSNDVCFYNMYNAALKQLLSQTAIEGIARGIGYYFYPQYSEPLQPFFDLNS